MHTISIKSNSPEAVIPLLQNAIDREKRILTESLRVTKQKLANMSSKLSVDPDKLMRGEIEHTDANDMDLIELEGEVQMLHHLEAELKELESLEICS